MYTAQHMQLSQGCTWRTVKDLKNSLLANCFRGDASNSLSPYLGKIISLLLIGQLKIKNPGWFQTSKYAKFRCFWVISHW